MTRDTYIFRQKGQRLGQREGESRGCILCVLEAILACLQLLQDSSGLAATNVVISIHSPPIAHAVGRTEVGRTEEARYTSPHAPIFPLAIPLLLLLLLLLLYCLSRRGEFHDYEACPSL